MPVVYSLFMYSWMDFRNQAFTNDCDGARYQQGDEELSYLDQAVTDNSKNLRVSYEH